VAGDRKGNEQENARAGVQKNRLVEKHSRPTEQKTQLTEGKKGRNRGILKRGEKKKKRGS